MCDKAGGDIGRERHAPDNRCCIAVAVRGGMRCGTEFDGARDGEWCREQDTASSMSCSIVTTVDCRHQRYQFLQSSGAQRELGVESAEVIKDGMDALCYSHAMVGELVAESFLKYGEQASCSRQS